MKLLKMMNEFPKKKKVGRPPVGKVAMTNAERQRLHRERKKRLGSIAKSQAV